MHPFILSCESTVDVPYTYLQAREIPVLLYTYVIDGVAYEDDMGRDPAAMPRFYQQLAAGALPKSSQLSQASYRDFFEELLQQGDVLHLAFGSGMTASVQNAWAAAEELRPLYPHRRLMVVDTLCSSSGYGLMVDCAADLRDEGQPMEAVAQWVVGQSRRVHHQFYSTDLTHYRRSGRMSGPAATLGKLLNICPIMRLNDEGRIIAYDKVRGQRAAAKRTVEEMAAHAVDGVNYTGKCWISHSNCPEPAETVRQLILATFPHIQGEIPLWDIGTIIAGHCGPGTVAVYFFGDERPKMA